MPPRLVARSPVGPVDLLIEEDGRIRPLGPGDVATGPEGPRGATGPPPDPADLIHTVTVGPAIYAVDYVTDGVDDHDTLEQAIADLPASGGKVRFVGQLTLGRAFRPSKAGVTVQGDGISSELKLAATADDNVITVMADDVTLDNFKVHGNRDNIEVDHHGVSVYNNARCKLSRLFITDTVHHGIQCSLATDIEIDHCYAQNTGKVGSNRDGVGIVIGGGQGACIGAKVSNCRVFNTGYHGFQVYRGSQHVEIVNCSAEKVGQTRDAGNSLEIHPQTYDVHVSQFIGLGTLSGANGAGIVVDSEAVNPPSKAVVLHSVYLEGHGLNGIVINGASDVTVSSSVIKNNGRTGTSSNKHGIRVRNGAAGDVPARVHIFGNHIFDDQAGGAKTQNDPIGVYDGSTDIAIFGNTFSGHAVTDAVVIDATSTGTVNRFLNTGDGGLTVAGDLTGNLLTPTVAKLRGKNLPAPGAGEDGKTFVYNHATGAYVWTSVLADAVVTPFKARSHRKVHQDVVSLYADWLNLSSNTAATAANDAYGYVMRVPKTGNLRDILLHVNAPSGNVSVWVYDVGSGGTTRTRLYSSGSIVCPAQGWNIIADPNIAVVEGQLLCIGFSVDNVVATFGRYNAFPGSVSAEIPAAFAPEGNVRMSCRKTASFPDPGATWTVPGLTTVPFGIVARVS
jgi:hypothetical protein